MDEMDRKILGLIQQDAGLSHQQLAQKVHLSASQCSRRLQRLQQDGYIDRQVALLDAEKLGLEVEAFVLVTLSSHARPMADAFHARMLGNPNVLDCAAITGDCDYIVRIAAASLGGFARIVNGGLLGHGDVASVRTSIVLDRIKKTTCLPV